MTRNIHVSTTGPEERLSGQKYLQNSSSSPLMWDVGSSPSEPVMGSCLSSNLAKPRGRWPRDSPGCTNRWVFLKPTSEERGPIEVQVLRPVQIPAGRTNHVAQLLIQNTSSPVSWGRGVSPSLHQRLFQLQTPRFSNTLSRWGHLSLAKSTQEWA